MLCQRLTSWTGRHTAETFGTWPSRAFAVRHSLLVCEEVRVHHLVLIPKLFALRPLIEKLVPVVCREMKLEVATSKKKKKKKIRVDFLIIFFFSTKQLVLLLFWIPSATCWHPNFCHICKYYSHFSLSLSPSLHKFGKDKVFVMFRVWSTETGMCALEALLL